MKKIILPAMLLFAVMGASAQEAAKKAKPVKKAPPTVEVVKFTPPKVVKDEQVKEPPSPKIVKDEEVKAPPAPPKVKRPIKPKGKIAPPPPPPPVPIER